MKVIGIVINLAGVLMLVAGLTGNFTESYETDVQLMKWGMLVGLVGLGIIAYVMWKKHKAGDQRQDPSDVP